MPVEMLGFDHPPPAGERFRVVESEREARQRGAAARPAPARGAAGGRQKSVSLEQLFSQIKEGGARELNLVIKADVQGSVEAAIGEVELAGAALADLREELLSETDFWRAASCSSRRRWARCCASWAGLALRLDEAGSTRQQGGGGVEAEHLDRHRRPGLLGLAAVVVLERAHLAPGIARHERDACVQRAALHEHGGDRPRPK